jgi:hypothetical protein
MLEPKQKSNPAQNVRELMCPSAEPEMEGSVIFGMVVGTATAPKLLHFDRVKQIPPALLTLESPVKPTEIFRIAATCIENGCEHFDGNNCRLTSRIIDELPVITAQIPPCPIRSTCRWWHQEGVPACQRCQQVVRDNYYVSDALYDAANVDIYHEESKILG